MGLGGERGAGGVRPRSREPALTRGFYVDRLSWRLDADFPINDGYRIVQVTPPGSECSVIFGEGLTRQEPGTLHGLQLTVTDILKAQEELTSYGVEVYGPFRDETGVFAGPVGENVADRTTSPA